MTQQLGGFWTLFLDRFKVTILLIVGILIMGGSAYKAIPRETEPTIDIPYATVTTIWAGATPGDVEKLITNKIEKEIKNLENIEEYTSYSWSGVSIVSIEFNIDSDNLENMQKLREKIDNVKRDLPDTIVDDPEITEISISDIPIVSVTINGDFSWSELKQFAEVLEDEFTSVAKVKDVNVKGAPVDEFHILVDPIKLQSKGLALSNVLSVVRGFHQDMPLGEIDIEGQKVEVTFQGEYESAAEFLDTPIRVDGTGAVVRLGDFATVRREFEEFDVETFLSTGNDPMPAVEIQVIKSASKGNVITMVQEIFDRVESLRDTGQLPSSLNVEVTYNRAKDIQKDLGTLINSGGQTLILIVIVMLLALGWREAFLASISIPLSMLVAVSFLYVRGDSFNSISLFALVLAVGLLVDNSIIIVEGMSEAIHDKKMSPHAAAIETIRLFRWPIISGTLTTIFAFAPMLFFISGISGDFVAVLPITVMVVLTAALLVALLLLPSIGAKFYAFFRPKIQETRGAVKALQDWYMARMHSILKSKTNIAFVLLMSFVVFLASTSLVITNRVPVEVFPSSDATFFAFKIELPTGSQLSETRQFIEPVSDVLREYFVPRENGETWVTNYVITVGRESDQTQMLTTGSQSTKHIMGVTVNLTDSDERSTPSYDIAPIIAAEIEPLLPDYVEFQYQEAQSGPSSGSAIEVRIAGDDTEHVEILTEELKSKLKEIEGLVNVSDNLADRTTQLTWRFDKDLLMSFGLTPSQILESLRASINGTTTVKITEGDDEIDVDLRIDWLGDGAWQDPQSLDVLSRIPIPTASGQFITLSQVATSQFSSELSEIQHLDGKRTLKVQADLKQGYVASQKLPELEKAISELTILPGETVEIGGDNEESSRLMTEMGMAMLCALLLILVVLVWQFNSFSQALIILAMVPMSLTGVFIGFWIAGLTISFPTMIGIVSLAGIIVNDAIVLIDRTNQNKKIIPDRIEACIRSGKERLQPILLTSVTTVVGMLPLSLSDEIWGGLGFAIVFGMMLSTPLCLLLIPCFLEAEYLIGHGIEHRLKKSLRQIFSKKASE